MQSYIILALITRMGAVGVFFVFRPGPCRIIGGFDWVGLKGVGMDPMKPTPDHPSSGFHDFSMHVRGDHSGTDHRRLCGKNEIYIFLAFYPSLDNPCLQSLAHWVWGSGRMAGENGRPGLCRGHCGAHQLRCLRPCAPRFWSERLGYGSTAYIPHNLPMTITGAALLWFGWFGFMQAAPCGKRSCSECLRGDPHRLSSGGPFLGSRGMDPQGQAHHPWRGQRCCGRTRRHHPGSGFCGACFGHGHRRRCRHLCYGGVMVKSKLRYDDSLDVVGIHGFGGTWGALATGLFATKAVNPAGSDGLFLRSSRATGHPVRLRCRDQSCLPL